MVKKSKSKSGSKGRGDDHAVDTTDDDVHNNSILSEMPIAQAVVSQDLEALERLIQTFCLPKTVDVTIVSGSLTLQQSTGAAFTGGRSTPVYYVSCKVQKKDSNNNNDSSTTTKTGGGNDDDDSTTTIITKERRFCIKLVQFPDGCLSSQAVVDHKRESYMIERRFYDSLAPKLLREYKIQIPKLFASDHDGKRPYPAHCWIMNDVRTKFPYSPKTLSLQQFKCALAWLATFHAACWNNNNANGKKNKGSSSSSSSYDDSELWSHGGFYTRDGGDHHHRSSSDVIPKHWMGTCKFFQIVCPQYMNEDIRHVGRAMVELAQPLCTLFENRAKTSHGTIIHGDYKPANLFFSTDASIDDNGLNANDGIDTDPSPQHATAVDFQYTGAGVGAEDVAYLLFPDAHGYVDYEDEQTVLRFYYDTLMEQLQIFGRGGPSTLSYIQFRTYYDLAQVNLCRYWVGRGWKATTEGDALLVKSVSATVAKVLKAKSSSSSSQIEVSYLHILETMVDD
mmetsp:Transcript_50711/g.122334  ORF Transcript_50711/g.122334 Transcript_50711/m.122334 type:complete len:507 (-) Transcript_50711:249-1769(-)|eukprot:CAMPEP_0113501060 /NCGR_PEP_ID=MMETSP0014_2-20120614/32720_1 /TAXON_ID=2857 /ORGANISM="Nitzschia sp." /LENGTH=506 /DNA_ID=CAMNT_0000395557 /DNA_START=72 /DNA_END=1592 /DNA_ORIENTATION=+ /assembly_acc=CAM_ASM_000159